MKIVGMIPARFKSTRFPGKPLANIKGKSLIKRVWDKAVQAIEHDHLYVLTDDEKIFKHCFEEGMQCLMTSQECLTGTDRVFEASKVIDADIYINIQGDEPLIDPADIRKVIDKSILNPQKVINAMCPITNEDDFFSPSIPKVISSSSGKLLYISRSPIPFNKDKEFKMAMKQVCIYAFPKAELNKFGNYNKKTPIEMIEDIEILRFLETGSDIEMIEVSQSSIAVDHPEDIERVLKSLND
jgi:3-deoxy-manno-octulosonate cytidylyltransferase (CMP-KDO synthetase)